MPRAGRGIQTLGPPVGWLRMGAPRPIMELALLGATLCVSASSPKRCGLGSLAKRAATSFSCP